MLEACYAFQTHFRNKFCYLFCKVADDADQRVHVNDSNMSPHLLVYIAPFIIMKQFYVTLRMHLCQYNSGSALLYFAIITESTGI